jgi:ABC-type transport system involved in multi-copper enzyme maturation permease subunit
MITLWPIALITFKEGIRNRAIYGITLLAMLLFIANFVICGMIMQEVGKVAVDIALSSVSLSGLLLVLFVGINLMAKDLDKKTIYMVLSRPISRSEYIIGKFLGMTLLIIFTMIFLGMFALLSIQLIKMGYPGYFLRFSWPMILLAMFFNTISLIMLSALAFLFASFASTSFITLIMTVIAYIIGMSLSDVKTLVETPGTSGIHPSAVTVKIVQAAYYLFPNLSIFDIKIHAAHAIPLSSSYFAWAVTYGVVYSALAITAAAIFFSRREFP